MVTLLFLQLESSGKPVIIDEMAPEGYNLFLYYSVSNIFTSQIYMYSEEQCDNFSGKMSLILAWRLQLTEAPTVRQYETTQRKEAAEQWQISGGNQLNKKVNRPAATAAGKAAGETQPAATWTPERVHSESCRTAKKVCFR